MFRIMPICAVGSSSHEAERFYRQLAYELSQRYDGLWTSAETRIGLIGQNPNSSGSEDRFQALGVLILS